MYLDRERLANSESFSWCGVRVNIKVLGMVRSDYIKVPDNMRSWKKTSWCRNRDGGNWTPKSKRNLPKTVEASFAARGRFEHDPTMIRT